MTSDYLLLIVQIVGLNRPTVYYYKILTWGNFVETY
jgi:hypothetical protein